MRKWNYIRILHSIVVGFSFYMLIGAFFLHWNTSAGDPVKLDFAGTYSVNGGAFENLDDRSNLDANHATVILQGNFVQKNGQTGLEKGQSLHFYLNHFDVAIYVNDSLLFETGVRKAWDAGVDADELCGAYWKSIPIEKDILPEDQVQIRLSNIHSQIGRDVYRDWLDQLYFATEESFESYQLSRAMPDWITVGAMLFFAIALLGTSAGYSAAGNPVTRQIIPYGLLCLFMGGYVLFDSRTLMIARDNLIFHNVGHRVCMMLSAFELSRMMLDHFTGTRRRIAAVAISVLGVTDLLVAAASFSASMNFYDTTLFWIPVQAAVSLLAMALGIEKLKKYGARSDLILISHMIMHGVMLLEFANYLLGWLPFGTVVKPVFMGMMLIYLMVSTGQVVHNHAKAAKVDRLERQLTEERIATMISQIQPHFIYNTLGTIGHLCMEQPEKAAELVRNFSMYLRGNFSELDNLSTIRLTSELDHVRYYTEIEKVRFPDMTVEFDIQCQEFSLPPLSVQPLVENAIKHGLMGLESGGTVKISSYETRTHYCVRVEDDGVGFDTAVLQDSRQHIGIRNIRSRLEAMCDGILTVESTPGVGTVATIRIPKQRRMIL